VSSELDEVFALADRIAVMYRGSLIGPFAADRYSREEIGLLMAGADLAEPAASGDQA
jgi:simple sugar transport system ATP-binding protein